jgi:hypothetical protein
MSELEKQEKEAYSFLNLLKEKGSLKHWLANRNTVNAYVFEDGVILIIPDGNGWTAKFFESLDVYKAKGAKIKDVFFEIKKKSEVLETEGDTQRTGLSDWINSVRQSTDLQA